MLYAEIKRWITYAVKRDVELRIRTARENRAVLIEIQCTLLCGFFLGVALGNRIIGAFCLIGLGATAWSF